MGLDFLEEWELPSPSNLLLQADKKDIGRIRIPSRLGFQRSSRHRRNILPLSEPEQLLEEKEVVGSDFLGLALLDDSRVVVFAMEIRNGLHFSAEVVLEKFPNPSSPLLQACKKDIGSIRIPSRLGSRTSSRHRRNILPLPE